MAQLSRDELRHAIEQIQASVLDEADSLTRHDLGAVLEQLEQGRQVDPAVVAQLETRITRMTSYLEVLSHDIVSQLKPPGESQTEDVAETHVPAKRKE